MWGDRGARSGGRGVAAKPPRDQTNVQDRRTAASHSPPRRSACRKHRQSSKRLVEFRRFMQSSEGTDMPKLTHLLLVAVTAYLVVVGAQHSAFGQSGST